MKHDDKHLKEFIDSWIENIPEVKAPLISPFFHGKILENVKSHEYEKVSVFDNLFLKVAAVFVGLLIFANLWTIYTGRSVVVNQSSVSEQIVFEYENIDKDSYNNYSLLAIDNNIGYNEN